jgi:hypothetical protein
MRAKGYSDVKAADQILVQQVGRESPKNKSKDTPCPKCAAASLLLAHASILPSLERKVRKTSHQETNSSAPGGAGRENNNDRDNVCNHLGKEAEGVRGEYLANVRMCDCCLEGIGPCKHKGNGHRWIGNQIFRLAEKEKK